MRKAARLLAALAAIGFQWTAGTAAADDPYARGFDPDPSRPALGFDSDFTVESTATAPAGSYRAEVLFDYQRNLLALKSGETKLGNLLESRLTAHLMGGYSFGRIEVGADLPVVLYQGANLSLLTQNGIVGPLADPISQTALGDLRLVARLPVLAQGMSPVSLAVVGEIRLPTGSKQSFTGDGPMAIPSVVVARQFGGVRLDGQLGYVARRQGQYAQLVVHDAVTYGLGASIDLPQVSLFRSWKGILDLNGQLPRGVSIDSARYQSPIALRAGVRARVGEHVSAELGMGTGLSSGGYGRDLWRIFFGLTWDHVKAEQENLDRDGDGVPDAEDRCPDVPGPADMEGCPDSDGDGVPDIDDKCPKEPGPAQNDGCPLGDEPVVEIQTEKLSLRDSIKFDTAKDTLRPDSFKILTEIVTILSSHPEIKRIRVEGHTDNVGGATYNRDLSRRRAHTVVVYLSTHGIAKERLTSEGYGFDRPVASNATAFGRAKNRRVEFVILAEAGQEPAAKSPAPAEGAKPAEPAPATTPIPDKKPAEPAKAPSTEKAGPPAAKPAEAPAAGAKGSSSSGATTAKPEASPAAKKPQKQVGKGVLVPKSKGQKKPKQPVETEGSGTNVAP
jgi:outer membrane protein OmpA-like peptidoglycan-associated protein